MANMKIKKGDTVVVLSGKDKGKQGKVQVVVPADRKVVVEGINIVTCHTKPRRPGRDRRYREERGPRSTPARCRSSAPSATRPPALHTRSKMARRAASASTAALRCKGGFDTWLD